MAIGGALWLWTIFTRGLILLAFEFGLVSVSVFLGLAIWGLTLMGNPTFFDTKDKEKPLEETPDRSKDQKRKNYPARVTWGAPRADSPDVEGLIVFFEYEEENIMFTSLTREELTDQEKAILKRSIRNWVLAQEKVLEEFQIPYWAKEGSGQTARIHREVFEINRALLQMPDSNNPFTETPVERQLFIDGVVWHEFSHYQNPGLSEAEVQRATLDYYKSRPDILFATLAVLDQNNPNHIYAQRVLPNWLVKFLRVKPAKWFQELEVIERELEFERNQALSDTPQFAAQFYLAA